MRREQLITFSDKVKQAFLDKRIHAPVHLCGGNEDQLIGIFKDMQPHDWCFSTWRSMYHALLKGIPEEWVFKEILEGRSMYLMNREHRFFCSSIVGGTLPIACGVAMAIKHAGGSERVWCFVGDMCARTGIFHEFLSYCDGHLLPVRVVIEDNGMSTNSPTEETWGNSVDVLADNVPIMTYKYQRTYPHVGVGQHVQF